MEARLGSSVCGPEPVVTEEVNYPQTKFFQACRGVFEGGGCRGAGHVGAYEAAIRCGVNLSEVAGTSAGSIVAALIGAGASPEFLLRTCAYLKFSELLAEPRGDISTPWYSRLASRFLRGERGAHRQDLAQWIGVFVGQGRILG